MSVMDKFKKGFMDSGTAASIVVQTGPFTITPTLGAELVVNGESPILFTGDNPNSWTVTGESGANPEITERAPNAGHADAVGVGGAINLFSSATNFAPSISEVKLTVGKWYRLAATITKRVQGSIRLQDAAGSISATDTSAVGSFYNIGRTTNTSLQVIARTAPTDITIVPISAKEITFSTSLLTWTYAAALATFGAPFTRPTANVPFGVVIYVDASNYILAWNNGANSWKLDKVVAGTLTTLLTVSATYTAAASLYIVAKASNKYDVVYNGVTIIADQTIADAVFSGVKTFGVMATDSTVTIGDVTYTPT